MTSFRSFAAFCQVGFSLTCFLCFTSPATAAPKIEILPGNHIAYIGNTLADRMQHHAWLETYLHAAYPNHQLTIRNLGFAGDELTLRPRSQNFGSADEWLTKVAADVVFCFFGYNEALRGPEGLPQFKQNLSELIRQMQAQRYNGKTPPKLVFFAPLAHENLDTPFLPDGTANNRNLEQYTAVMKQVCESAGVPFVDLFQASRDLYQAHAAPLTMNGIHLLEHGDQAIADVILSDLLGIDPPGNPDETRIERLRQAVLNKNLYWFSRYRVVDGFNVYGGRSKLNWFGQSNYDVLQREMEIFDVMTTNRDQHVWALANGVDQPVDDSNVPELLDVQTNLPGELEDGRHPYLGGEAAISKMTVADGMQVNLFASEEMFPELINPVQMAVDTDGRLFVSVWPSYPHWTPTQPRTDRIICLPDDNQDGVADRCVVFADELNSITGFEFWGGGMLVCAPPEIWYLRDTDGDDRADFRLRILQGVSSADTHHTANAMVIGPDGGLYWSRGIFHFTNMETPTKTFRSTSSGVYRFDPRTFEIDFHFPIGPNPHGDVFDQWGYQFANDGTSGTGSYVNIGKGIGNKQWYKKRVRPVSATAILSSSHFPQENNGNFLICNTIGFLGVLQHEVKYNGADIYAEEIEPILYSSDPTFRPSDLEVGGDGALYVADWSNALIGHMQHNIRDPNRDRQHGRIYRVTATDRPLLKPFRMKGQPIATVLQAFFAPESGTRYRARLELSGRDRNEVIKATQRFAEELDPDLESEAQALLESLWVFQEQRVVNRDLLARVFNAEEPRVRAAAIRTLGQWGSQVDNWQPLLLAAARDSSPLVRAEAVKAATSFPGLVSAEVIFEVANQPTDPELDTVINYARQQLQLDQIIDESLASNQPLSSAARLYLLTNADVDDLLKLGRTPEIFRAILARENLMPESLRTAIDGLAQSSQQTPLDLILSFLGEQRDQFESTNRAALGTLLVEQPVSGLAKRLTTIKQLAQQENSDVARPYLFAAWISANGSGESVFVEAQRSYSALQSFLESVPHLPSDELKQRLLPTLEDVLETLPAALEATEKEFTHHTPGLEVAYFEPNPPNADRETLAAIEAKATGIASDVTIDVPQLQRRDRFALRFEGNLKVTSPGIYRFFLSSDDGSRLYIDDQLVVNNDGLHGMVEKSSEVTLNPGPHPITVTYFDNGGGDGLKLSWQGPGIQKQPIPQGAYFVGSGETLRDIAIRVITDVPGNDGRKAESFSKVILAGKSESSAIHGLLQLPIENVPDEFLQPLVEAVANHVSEIPTQFRTTKPALEALRLVDSLANLLPPDQARAYQARAADLAVNIIRIGTVPHRMIYDKERIVVQAGKPVEFIFTNTDNMPHNFAVVAPGSLEEIGTLAEATSRDADAIQRHYIPTSDKILVSGTLLQPGESEAIAYQAPSVPGVYPYVCTYPGHWRRMYGAMYVVEDLKSYLKNPDQYLANQAFEIKDELLNYNTRDTDWKFAEFADSLSAFEAHDPHADETHQHGPGRSYEVGQSVFRVANCGACHRLNGEGIEFGPDLAKLDPKKQNVKHVLQSILEPSQEIEDKYRTYAFELESGRTVNGVILEESADAVKIIVDPLAKSEPIVISTNEIEERTALPVSQMPKGLLNKLSREEILDLLAYVLAGGNQEHDFFTEHQHD